MNLKAQRAAVLKAAQDIVAKAKAENRDLTAEEIAEIETKTAEIKDLDAKIATAEKGAALVKAIGGLGSDDEFGWGGGLRLDLKGIARRTAGEMSEFSRKVSPFTKGLVPTGETIIDIPLVNTEPIPGLGQDTPPRLVDVLPVAQRQAPVYSFLKQTVIASPGAASVVAPGDLKPTLKLGVERVDARLRVLAVLSEGIDKFLLEDAANLQTWVGAELADAIMATLETEVLDGDGTGQHFTGLAHTSGIQTQAFVTDPLVTVQAGLTKLQSLGIPPAFVALPAADWLAIQTTRNASGNFDVGGPVDATAQTAWGVQVVVVPGLTAGTGYIVGQDSLTLSTDAAALRVEWGTPGDSFSRNQIVARCEGRFNLDVMKPHGIVKLTLTA